MSTSKKNYPEGVYHEKQSRQLCALHALNNLFQEPKAFTKQDLDDICNSLSPDKSWFNPHRSIIGLGNYDVNVVMAALQTKDCDTVWFDKRKNVEDLNFANIIGFIMNIPTDISLGFVHIPVQRKHWIAIRKVGDTYYSFDSKLKSPQDIGCEISVQKHLKEQISSKDKELFVVFKHRSDGKSIWNDKGDTELVSERTCSENDEIQRTDTISN